MKDQVLKFLGDLPQAGSDQFNKALELYRKTKGHDVGKVRFYNTLGFSVDRLESLLYDLKKSNRVTDVEAANAKRSKSTAPKGEAVELANDSEKETLEINSEELETEDLAEKLEEHISANQIEVNAAEEVSTPLDETEPVNKVAKDPFLQKISDFNLEEEKYNSIKSFAAEVSNFTGENPKDQKSATLKAFIEDAKKKLL